MMDVSASYLKLHDLVDELKNGQLDDKVIKTKLVVFIMQTFASDRAIGKFLKLEVDKLTLIPTQTTAKESGWISIPIGNHRSPTPHSATLFSDITLDEIGGHYWGSRVSNFSNTNHRYFAWPGAERGEYKKVSRLVQMMLNNSVVTPLPTTRFSQFMGSGLRNSLFLQPVLESLLLLIDRLECVPFFDGSPVKISSDSLVFKQQEQKAGGGDSQSTESVLPEKPAGSEQGFEPEDADRVEVERESAARFDAVSKKISRSQAYSIHKIKLVAAMRAELQALSNRVERASKGEFKLYGGVSWPVREIKDPTAVAQGKSNFNVFGPQERIPRVSGGRLVDAVELIARSTHVHGAM
jgi:hypothetical protein